MPHMTIQAGVWIDHSQAVVVRLDKGKEEVRHIDCEGSSHASSNEQANHSYSSRDIVPEDRLERKQALRLAHYYDEVITLLHDADAIVIMGPGEAKGEFVKRIVNSKLDGRVRHIGVVDKMTTPQIIAYIKKHTEK